MEQASELLFKGFVELCEKLVNDAYVITDGRQVLTAVLDHAVATKLCSVMIDRTNDKNWKVAKIADALELAFRNGYNTACGEFQKHMSGEEANAAPEQEGVTDEQDSQLRDSKLQQQE